MYVCMYVCMLQFLTPVAPWCLEIHDEDLDALIHVCMYVCMYAPISDTSCTMGRVEIHDEDLDALMYVCMHACIHAQLLTPACRNSR